MGVKYFFAWMNKKHADVLHNIKTLDDFQLEMKTKLNTEIDVFSIDLNGIFHPCAQKVFGYGKYPRKLLIENKNSFKKNSTLMFQEVSNTIISLVNSVNPKKTLILAIDGVAGAAKMAQQRQRRFKSSKENIELDFDPNSMTPGTKFMDQLSTYLLSFIEDQISKQHWKFNVIFSNEKTAGEGEAKIFSYLRKYCDEQDTFCIYGLDADLIMLCMASMRKRIFVYRENMYGNGYYIVNIDLFSSKIKEYLNTESAILDFVFICFLVGNDFLPQIPTLEIFNDGIEHLLNIYKEYCLDGMISVKTKQIDIRSFKLFIQKVSELETEICISKYRIMEKYFPDPLFTKHFSLENENIVFDFQKYKSDFYKKKFNNQSLEFINKVAIEYTRGMQWVIHYYTQGIPTWDWYYPYYYAPFLCDLSNLYDYSFIPYPETFPYLPFQQLLAVLPPNSRQLIAYPLDELFEENSCISYYYPKEFEINIEGKRAEWEGIVILPFIDMNVIVIEYNRMKKSISSGDMKRNQIQRPIHYIITDGKIKKKYL